MKEFFVNLIFINKFDPKMVWLRQFPTPELQLRQSLVASAKMKVDRISSDGKRLVGQKEWNLLQQQI
jgi:hypothetical protein